MEYKKIADTYSEIKEKLLIKKDAVIKKNLELLQKTDEELLVLCEQLKTFDIKEAFKNFSQTEKIHLKDLAKEIKTIENNNEILIKHSLDVINELMSGILNIAKKDIQTYNQKGENCLEIDDLDTSSITEEA